jgi:hypothetical protein
MRTKLNGELNSGDGWGAKGAYCTTGMKMRVKEEKKL